MTLIELLLVMALLALLLGTGAGMLARLDLGQRAALGTVQNVIRSARNSAVARNAPARVRMDRAAGTISAEAMEVIGTWHFETPALKGAFEIDGRPFGGEVVEGGFTGRALDLGEAGAHALFPVANLASWDLEQGFSVECALRPAPGGAGKLLSIGDTVEIELTREGAVRAWFLPLSIDPSGRRAAGGKRALESAPGALAAGRWSRLRFEYDRRLLRLYVDGLEVARADEEAPVWSIEGPLALSDHRRGFGGAIDNLVVAAVAASEALELPDTVSFAGDTPSAIHFDSGGHLDRELHREPILFHLEFEDGERAPVRVGLYGTVE